MRGGSGGAMRPAEPTVSPIGGVNSFETGPLGPSPLGVFNSLKALTRCASMSLVRRGVRSSSPSK